MGNCLKTQLKENVNNDNLDMLGYMELIFNSDTLNNPNCFELTKAGVIKVRQGTIGGQTEINVTANKLTYFSSLGTLVIAEGYDALKIYLPKYTIKKLRYEGHNLLDMHQLNFSEFCESIISTRCDIIMSETVLSRLKELKLNLCPIQNNYDISELGANGIMTSIALSGSTGVSGSLDKAGMSPLTTFGVPNTKNVSLSIENFVGYNRIAGRTSGSLNLSWVAACNATFNGAVLPLKETTALSWTASTITVDDVTIDA